MKNLKLYLLFLSALIIVISSCKKDPIDPPPAKVPKLQTLEVTDATAYSAISGGLIIDAGDEKITHRGICWSFTPSIPTIDSSRLEYNGHEDEFLIQLENLRPWSEYKVRAYAVSEAGVGYGQTVTLITKKTSLPIIQTLTVSEVGIHSAISGGKIISSGSDPITASGICFGTNVMPTIANHVIENLNNENEFIGIIENLSPFTKYYVRAYAINDIGIAYGGHLEFTTDFDTISDIDGNIYRIVQIGNQTWTIDNFNSTRLRDGTPIPNRLEDEYWTEDSPKEPAMCWYENNRTQYEYPYGAIYNWYAASHPLIAPEGWRVPSNDDFIELVAYLGGSLVAGGPLKATGTDYWLPPNTGATNSSNFTALPGGGRHPRFSPTFYDVGRKALFWTRNDAGPGAFFATIFYDNIIVNHQITLTERSAGLRLRLLKNTP
jgi:uncharacterized protein (TIGR02145 family)